MIAMLFLLCLFFLALAYGFFSYINGESKGYDRGYIAGMRDRDKP